MRVLPEYFLFIIVYFIYFPSLTNSLQYGAATLPISPTNTVIPANTFLTVVGTDSTQRSGWDDQMTTFAIFANKGNIIRTEDGTEWIDREGSTHAPWMYAAASKAAA